MEVLLAGIGAPSDVGELIWYGFGLLATYFLWSIRSGISQLRQDLQAERNAREILTNKIAAMQATCEERHR